MLRIRLARRGRRNLNTFAIVVADQKCKRDGKFIEKIGYYQPTLKNDDPYRLKLEQERFEHWVKMGAQATDKVQYLAARLNYIAMPEQKELTKKAAPKKKAIARAKKAAIVSA